MLHKQERKHILDAMETATKSNMKMKHGCVIVNGKGNVISKACNTYETAVDIKPYTKGKYGLSCHAEENALKKVDYKLLYGAKLYVTRVSVCDNQFVFMNSKPCHRCTTIINKCIQKYGLKMVYYSTEDLCM